MKIQSILWMLGAMVACACAPAFAMEHGHAAHMHHEMAAPEPAEHHHHMAHAAAPEEIPATPAASTDDKHDCPHHAGRKCTCPSRMVISHCGTGGCCYKPEMPSAINLNGANAQEVAHPLNTGFELDLSFVGILPIENDQPSLISFPPDPRPPLA